MTIEKELTIFQRLEELCRKNNTNITALCKEITGSSGNLATWKKDNIRPHWLIEICRKFNVTADFILTGNSPSTNRFFNNSKDQELMTLWQQLSENDKQEILDIMLIKLRRNQKLSEKNMG